jgi:hypothetical protein
MGSNGSRSVHAHFTYFALNISLAVGVLALIPSFVSGAMSLMLSGSHKSLIKAESTQIITPDAHTIA